MADAEAYYIIPSPPLRSKPNRADGPYDTVDEAKKAAGALTFGLNIWRVGSDLSLDHVEYKKPDKQNQMDEASRAAHEANQRTPPGRP